MPETIKPKLCKFRELDVMHIDMIKEKNGFHEDMTAIRFALHLAAMLGAQPPIGNNSKKTKKSG